MATNKALLIIDVQNDFCENGNLAVAKASEIIPIINKLMLEHEIIIATKDWHPIDHQSFAANHTKKNIGDKIFLGNTEQVLWPQHCVQNTLGSEFHPKLNTTKINKIFYKGENKEIDSYSGFYDNDHKNSTGLYEHLDQLNIQDLYIVGLATDYCVKYSALDAKKLGFNVFVIKDACRGVEINKGDIEKAVAEMQDAGVVII